MFLNLFRAVAHFKGSQILVVHFRKNFDVTTTITVTGISIRSHGSKVDLQIKKSSLPVKTRGWQVHNTVEELISKQKVIASLGHRMAPLVLRYWSV